MFVGTYHRTAKHPSDLDAVVSRARLAGVERMLITGTSLSETSRVLEFAKRYGRSSSLHHDAVAE